MDGARWKRLGDLFEQLRVAPPGVRESALSRLADEDPEMAEELGSLLAADASEGLLDKPVVASLGELLSEPLPERIGPYVVAGEIGRGGMGIVSRAHDPRLRRDVAIKLLPRALVHDPVARDRFLAEARAASALDHPHICTIHDIGELSDGRLYLAMAWYARGTLADRLVAGPLEVHDAIEMGVQIAGALHAAHEAGIVHRDVKPHNIAFDDGGEARLLDFGVATLGSAVDGSADRTAGTAAYMAPEQVNGEAVDRRADVWSLGVVLYETLAGRRPFDGRERADVLSAIVQREPPGLRALAPRIPGELARVVERALRKDPAERYATAAELQQALRSLSKRIPSPRRPKRSAALAGGSVIAAAALVALGLVYLRGRDGALATAATDGVDPGAVIVLPFRVSGDPGLGYLREGMVDLLAARLTGDPGLRAADPRTVQSRWRVEFGERTADLPADSALRFARGLGAAHVLLGDVVGTPSGLVMNASILDSGGRPVGRATVEGPHERLAELVDRLVGQLLSLGAGEDPERLAALTSTSLPALRAFLEGQLAYRSGEYGDALIRFSSALAYDSTFALAGLGLALASGWVGGEEPLRERGFTVAWRFRERLSERDRSLLLAHVGPGFPQPPTVLQLVDATERALLTSPDRAELWYKLGDLHFHFGRFIDGEDWRERAAGALDRALELEPAYAPALHHLVALHAFAGRPEALRAAADAYLARDSIGATADYVRWRVSRALGDPSLAGSVAMDAMSAETLGWIAMNTVDEGFALEDGVRAAEQLAVRPGTNPQRLGNLMAMYSYALNAGLGERARRAAEAVRGVQPDPGFSDRLDVLTALYADGDPAAAEAAAGRLVRPDATPLDRCVLALWRLGSAVRTASGAEEARSGGGRGEGETSGIPERLCEAVVAATREVQATGRGGPRLAALDSLIRSGPVSSPQVDGHSEYAQVALSRLWEDAGDLTAALQAVGRRVYFIGWNHYLATSLREEARLAELAGEPGRAMDAWTHYLALRSKPEPRLAEWSEDARAALVRLSSSTPR